MSMASWQSGTAISRRNMLARAAGGFGAIALAGMLAEESARAASTDPMAPREGHFPARAKNVIFFFSTGGTSHVDTFDYKPQLFAGHGKSVTANEWLGKPGKFERFLKKSNWEFRPYGESGTRVSDLFPHLGKVIDDVCIINSLHGDHPGHDKATMGMHTGSFNVARPSIGSWVSYGLGTENRNLPSFLVLAPAAPYAGAQTWGSDFLPACHQGTHVIPGPVPLPNLKPLSPSSDLQQMELALLKSINQSHQKDRRDDALEARIRSFETAFGMQKDAPEAFDLSKETRETHELYGVAPGATSGFGWQCLVARRMVERGVRFIEVIDSGSQSAQNWDSHGDMNAHAPLAKMVDQPMAALIADLKRRGMLDSTLIVWTTEFGRTPFNTSADHKGREHHQYVFSSWLAGGGVKGGLVWGSSDEFGMMPAENPVHVHDFHATILHLLGIDHERLTYRYAGRDYRLTDVAGEVVRGILA